MQRICHDRWSQCYQSEGPSFPCLHALVAVIIVIMEASERYGESETMLIAQSIRSIASITMSGYDFLLSSPHLSRIANCKFQWQPFLRSLDLLQGDHSACGDPPVDFKTKVPFWPGLAWPSGTFVLKSTGGSPQAEWSPCIVILRNHGKDLIDPVNLFLLMLLTIRFCPFNSIEASDNLLRPMHSEISLLL